METYETLLATIALTMGASWASGINLYATLLVLGVGGSSGYIDLPQELHILQDPLVIAAAAIMYFIEFIADKVPGVDTSWDALHTFVRIPAGALLAAGAVGDVTPAIEIAAGILGAGLATTSHATKAGTRLMINTSPEPVTNWGASIAEDLVVLGGLWTALNHPLIFLLLLVVFIAIAAWAIPRLWRLLKKLFARIARLLGLAVDDAESAVSEKDSADPLKRLERLQALRAAGTLSEAEFEQQKQKILGADETANP